MKAEVVADRYELQDLLGTGGMSSVYRARDTVLERDVALKILHEHYSRDAEYVERFRREARAVARLSHPNIVTVIDRGEAGGRQFIVFEYVSRRTLEHELAEAGRLPVRRALEVAIAIADALALAHEHGLVHRDVKPQNVLLDGDGEAKVTDFGIARSLDVEQSMTASGTVLGTSNYISPEQASGLPVDAKTDVYSLGVVLFELLTGRVPFTGESFVAVAMQHVHDPPPSLLEHRPDAPVRLAAAVDRALAKDPADRFASMDDFAAELRACLAALDGGGGEESTLVRGIPALRRVRGAVGRGRRPVLPALLVVLGVVLLAAAIAGVLLARRGGTPNGASVGGGAGEASIALHGVAAYDPPPGDGHEHDNIVQDATDGNLQTYWTTEHYRSFDKPGVGLVLDAGKPVSVRQLTIRTDTPGFTAEIQSGGSASGPFRTVSAAHGVGADTTFSVSSQPERYYVVWITNPGPGGVAHVNEVTAH